MRKNKILKILEILLLIIAAILMISILANNYIKVSNINLNINLRLIQVILVAILAVITLIMTLLDNKKVFLILSLFYILTIILYIIFKNAGRI